MMKEIVFILLSFKTDSALFFVNLTDDRMSIFNIYCAVFCLLININEISIIVVYKTIFIQLVKRDIMEQTASKNAPFLRMDQAVRENATVLTKYVTISTDVCNQLDTHLLSKVIFF